MMNISIFFLFRICSLILALWILGLLFFGYFPTFMLVFLERLSRPVDLCEVKKILFSIERLKAPGIDGFPTLFH